MEKNEECIRNHSVCTLPWAMNNRDQSHQVMWAIGVVCENEHTHTRGRMLENVRLKDVRGWEKVARIIALMHSTHDFVFGRNCLHSLISFPAFWISVKATTAAQNRIIRVMEAALVLANAFEYGWRRQNAHSYGYMFVRDVKNCNDGDRVGITRNAIAYC